MEKVECVVIGAGVVGLAIARALARAGREVIVVEAEGEIGTGISSRNSEVIHAGIYYPQNSLMAQFCVAGKKALYAFCQSHSVLHENCGKLIAATSPEEDARLTTIAKAAAWNGVDLQLLGASEARALEPELACVSALFSSSTGIIDSHGYMLALQGDAEAAGASFAFKTPFVGGCVMLNSIQLFIGGKDPLELGCRWLINAAGLQATSLARKITGLDPQKIPETYLAKGNYFALCGQKSPFKHLIYPVPVPGGLGVHLTFDLAHQARFGPDVEWVSQEDYTVDPRRAESFYAAIRRYWPGLKENALQPAYCGIRPKLSPPSAPAMDFCIQGPEAHGVPGLINLFGIESPGLTASLALADYVKGMVEGAVSD